VYGRSDKPSPLAAHEPFSIFMQILRHDKSAPKLLDGVGGFTSDVGRDNRRASLASLITPHLIIPTMKRLG